MERRSGLPPCATEMQLTLDAPPDSADLPADRPPVDPDVDGKTDTIVDVPADTAPQPGDNGEGCGCRIVA